MAENVGDLTIEYVDNGVVTLKELDKEVLSKGAWATIMYKYQDLNRKTNEYGPEKFSIRRYQKRDGQYQLKSKFNISSKDQAEKLIAVLQKWL